MATLHSGYADKPESLLESAASQHSQSIEPSNLDHFPEKTTEKFQEKPADSSVAAPAPATTESAGTTAASNPPHSSNIQPNGVNPHQHEVDSADTDSSLPPVDTGKDAWLFLLAAFILNVLVWSTAFYGYILVHIICVNTIQVSRSPTEFSRNITPHTRHSRASGTLPLLVPALWDSCISLRPLSLAYLCGALRGKGLASWSVWSSCVYRLHSAL